MDGRERKKKVFLVKLTSQDFSPEMLLGPISALCPVTVNNWGHWVSNETASATLGRGTQSVERSGTELHPISPWALSDQTSHLIALHSKILHWVRREMSSDMSRVIFRCWKWSVKNYWAQKILSPLTITCPRRLSAVGLRSRWGIFCNQ